MRGVAYGLVMKRAVAIAGLVLTLSACGSPGTPVAVQIASPSAIPTTAPSPSSTPIATALRSARATWGDSASTGDIVSHLRAAGLKIDVRDPVPGATPITLFGARTTEQFTVENERLTLYSFGAADQAESIFQLVSQRRETVTWSATPYFVKIGSNLAVMTTMDEAVARRVVEALTR